MPNARVLGTVALCLSVACVALGGEATIELSIDGPAKVGRFEKIEFSIKTDAPAGNPFDPADVDVSLEIKTPSGKTLKLPAFWMQPYERREANGREWMYPSVVAGFRARFAPAEVGTYSCKAIRKDKSGVAPASVPAGKESVPTAGKDVGATCSSKEVSFEAVNSARKGYLRVSTVDPRFFEFTDGTPFFVIGQNLAFIGYGQYMKLRKAQEAFGKLSANGANFLRIWACCEDWAMAIEARKSAWGRSWGGKQTFVDVVEPGVPAGAKAARIGAPLGGNLALQPACDVALKPGTQYEISMLVKTEEEAAFELAYGGKVLGEEVKSKDAWAPVKRTITTGPNEMWLGRVELRSKRGPALVRKISMKEVAAAPSPLTPLPPARRPAPPGEGNRSGGRDARDTAGAEAGATTAGREVGATTAGTEAGATELLWEAEIGRPVRGYFNQPDCAMLDALLESAEKNNLYIELTFFTRDLYMNTLSNEKSPEYTQAIEDGKRLLRYVVARWGYSPSVAMWEYFNEQDPGKPTNRAYKEWGEYFEQIDIYHHMRSTSAWGPAPKDWAHEKLDSADLHWYLRPAWGELSKDSAAAAIDRAKFLREKAPNKPALLSEFGLADDKWGLSPYMNQDKAHLHFHDALWASAHSGLSGTAMFWWWEQIDKNDGYGQYKALSAYLSDVPFAAAHLQPAVAKSSPENVRAFALQGKDCAYVWLNDSRFTWWKVLMDKAEPSEVKDASVTLTGLEAGAYKVQWWDTLSGKIVKEETGNADAGGLKVSAPVFTRDIAVKVRK
ncbi:MAG TPA: DUF5060 domain-containing protein [Planctomycetota bacterium]|jgi:hypothetical protein